MNVINLSGEAPDPPYKNVAVPPDVLDEIHQAISSSNTDRLSDLLLRCNVEGLVFSGIDNVPVFLTETWPEIIVVKA